MTAPAYPSRGTTNWDTALKTYLDGATAGINVQTAYGAKGDGTTNDTAAIANAVAAAKAAKRGLYFPQGTYNITGDVTIDWDDAGVWSDATGAVLNFTGGGLVIDGTASGYRSRTAVANLQIKRGGAAGPALYVLGAGSGTGVTRTYIQNVRIESSTGDALKLTSSYNIDFHSCYFRNAAQGLNINVDGATGATGGYAVRFFGGEVQQCTKAGTIVSATLVNFYGTAIEGNQQGLEVRGLTRLINFFGCYFEANGNTAGSYDLLIGSSSNTVTGPIIKGCWFSDGSIGKTQSIQLQACNGAEITSNYFAGWTTNSPIFVTEAAAGSVSGYAHNNATNGSAAITNLNGSTTFNQPAPFSRTIESTQTITPTAIAANSQQNINVTVTGAVGGDRVHVNSNGGLTAGIGIVDAFIGAANTVTVRLANFTTASVTPAAFTALITVFKK